MELGPVILIVAALQFGLTALVLVVVWARGGFSPGAGWSPGRTRDGWVMRRRIGGQVETRPATDAEAAEAQREFDYQWWAIR